MTPTQKAAMQQAIEALETPRHPHGWVGRTLTDTEAAKALRAALAEPAVEPISCQWLAEMIMADLGYSSNDFRMLAKITERIVDYDRSNAPPPPAEVPLLTEGEVAQCIKDASKGSAINRDGSTSQRIARAIEQAVRRNAGIK